MAKEQPEVDDICKPTVSDSYVDFFATGSLRQTGASPNMST